MLKIIIGKAKSGKQHRVYQEVIALVKNNAAHRAMLIVPEQYTLEAEKQLIAQGDLSGFIGLEILSLKRLAHFVFGEVGYPKEKEISDLGKLMLLKQIFEQEKKSLGYYQRAFDKNGLLQKCYELIEELKQNRISPNMLQAFIDQGEIDVILSSKLQDILAIFKAYEKEKDTLFMDHADYYEALIEKIPQSNVLKEKHIWIDGFDSFSVQELAIIEALCHQAREVTITLTTSFEGARDIYAHTAYVLEKLRNFEGVPVEIVQTENVFIKADLHHLSQNLTTYPIEVWQEKPDHIHLFGAQNRATEVEWVAREILTCMREKGWQWRDIAVVTNDISSYRMVIMRIFDQYNLPYFIDEKRNILNHPVVHFIMGIVGVFTSGFKADDVMMLLKTGFWDLSYKAISDFENYLIEFGIRGKAFEVPFYKNHTKPHKAYDLEAINATREVFIAPLFDYQSALKKCVTVKEHLEALYTLMIALDIQGQIDHEVILFTEKHDFENAQLYAQIWNVILHVIDQLATLTGDLKLTLEQVWERLEIGLEQSEVGLLPLSDQHILVGSLDRSRAHPIKAMFLIGVNDGILPEGGSDQQLILEHEKQMINVEGVKWLSDQTMFIQKENFNIYHAVTRPSEKLYMSYAYADYNGGALRPSYLVGKIKQIFPRIKVQIDHVDHLEGSEMVASLQGTYQHLASQMRTHLDGGKIDPIWFGVMAWFKSNQVEAYRQLLSAAVHHQKQLKLNEEQVKELYELPIKTSVSGLEQYVQCPFKHFVSQGLRPNQPKPYEINYPDVGILFHSSLEKFGKTLHERKLAWEELTREECEILIEEIVLKLVDAEIYQSKFQYKALVRKLMRVSKRAIWTLTRQLQKGAFKPRAFELAFTDGPFGVPPIMVALPSGERMMIRGVVDRIDILEENGVQYLKIVDYKSGARTFNMTDVYHGLQMQLFVYMSACLKHPEYFGASKVLPGGLYYYRIDDPMIESTSADVQQIDEAIEHLLKLDGVSLDDENVLGALDFELFERQSSSVVQVKIKKDGDYTKDSKVLSKDSFNDLMAHVDEKIEEIGEAILSGDISVSPCRLAYGLSCQTCDYNGICQFDEKQDYQKIRKFEKLSVLEMTEKLAYKNEKGED
jgi:ATP-dependent helicase/nuclease subunit B